MTTDLEALEKLERKRAADFLRDTIACGYRLPDGSEQCVHGKFRWEDCIACYDEELMRVADQIETGEASRARASLSRLDGEVSRG